MAFYYVLVDSSLHISGNFFHLDTIMKFSIIVRYNNEILNNSKDISLSVQNPYGSHPMCGVYFKFYIDDPKVILLCVCWVTKIVYFSINITNCFPYLTIDFELVVEVPSEIISFEFNQILKVTVLIIMLW